MPVLSSPQIDVLASIGSCDWLLGPARELMRRYCSLVHGVEVTPFPSVDEIVETIRGRVLKQIVYIYHGNDENSPSVYKGIDRPTWNEKVMDMNSPSFYGYAQHVDGSMSIACLLRKPGFADRYMMQGMIDHFTSLSSELEGRLGYESGTIKFSGVGILPGWINKLAKSRKIKVPDSIIQTNIEKNANSARFVAEAWRRKVAELQSEGKEFIPVILGYKGTLGEATLIELGIDPLNPPTDLFLIEKGDESKFPTDHFRKDVVVLDLTKGSLKEYLPQVARIAGSGNKCYWVNEAYPFPDQETLMRAGIIGARIDHIVGVEGDICPQLTGPYEGAIPCCMAIIGQDASGVIVREISYSGSVVDSENHPNVLQAA